jgi:hypothetical protein
MIPLTHMVTHFSGDLGILGSVFLDRLIESDRDLEIPLLIDTAEM